MKTKTLTCFIRLFSLTAGLITWMGTTAFASEPSSASELQLPWALIQRHTLQHLPRSGSVPLPQGSMDWSRWAAENEAERIHLKIQASEFKLGKTELQIPSSVSQGQGMVFQTQSPRVQGPPLLLSQGASPDTLRVSYRPTHISLQQIGATRLTAEDLKIKQKFGSLQLENVSIEITGVRIDLDSALEAMMEAPLEINSQGIPQIKALKPEIRIDPSRIQIPCSSIEVRMDALRVEDLQTRPELAQEIKEKACEYFEKNKDALWKEHAPKLKALLEQKLMPDLLRTTNEKIQAAVEDQQKNAVQMALVGLAAAQEGVRIGFGPQGQNCAFDPETPLRSLKSDEALLLLSERDSNHLLQQLLKDPANQKFDLPGIGTLSLSEIPKIRMLKPGDGETAGSFEVDVQGLLALPEGKNLLPGYPSLAQAPIQASGKLRVRPVVKDGLVSLELLRDLELNVQDADGKQVQFKQDKKGGSISLPETTLQSLANDWLVDFSKQGAKPSVQGNNTQNSNSSSAYSMSSVSQGVIDTRSRGLTSLQLTPEGKVLTPDGKAVVGTLDSSGKVVDPSGKVIPHLEITEVRSVTVAGKPMRLLGRPKLELGPDGTLEAEIKVDVDSKTHADVAWVDNFLTEPTYVSKAGSKGKPATAQEDTRDLDHVTAKVRGKVRFKTEGDQVSLEFIGLAPITASDTNLNTDQRTWTGAALGGIADLGFWAQKQVIGVNFPASGTDVALGAILNETRKGVAASMSNGGKPWLKQSASAIPGWDDFSQRHDLGVNLKGISTTQGKMTLSYEFKNAEKPAIVALQSTDTGLASNLIGDRANSLLDLAHLRDLRIKTDPRTGQTQLEALVAEGPAPWRLKPEINTLPELGENQPR